MNVSATPLSVPPQPPPLVTLPPGIPRPFSARVCRPGSNSDSCPDSRLLGNPPDTVRDFGGIADVNRQVVVGRRATYKHTERVPQPRRLPIPHTLAHPPRYCRYRPAILQQPRRRRRLRRVTCNVSFSILQNKMQTLLDQRPSSGPSQWFGP